MKIAFLIEAHSDPRNLARLIERLQPHDVFVHLDLKTPMTSQWKNLRCTYVQPRVAVHWAGFSQVCASISLIRAALESDNLYSKLVLLSGACYPIKPVDDLSSLFLSDGEFNYIKYVDMRNSSHLMSLIERPHLRDALLPNWALRSKTGSFANKACSRIFEQLASFKKPSWPPSMIPFHGSSWWAISPAAAQYCLECYDSDISLSRLYRKVFASDEQFYHTLIGNSAFSNKSTGEIPFVGRGTYRAANLHFIDPSLSKWFSISDFDKLLGSDKYFVRKVRTESSSDLLDLIDKKML